MILTNLIVGNLEKDELSRSEGVKNLEGDCGNHSTEETERQVLVIHRNSPLIY